MLPPRGDPVTDVGVLRRAQPSSRDMLAVASMVLGISMAAFVRVPVLPDVGASLDMGASELGLVTTAFAVGRLATDIPAGRLADLAVPSRLLGAAGMVLASGCLTFAMAPAESWVVAAAAVLGIGSAMANTTGMAFFSTARSVERRGMSMAAFSAALLGGQALGPMLGGVVGQAWGWRVALMVAAGLALVVGLVGLSGRRATPRARRHPPARGRVVDRPAANVTVSRPGQLRILYAVAFSSFFMLGSMPQTLVPIIGADEFALGAGTIGAVLGLGGVCRLAGSLAGGWVADRVSRKASLVPGLVLGSAGVSLLALDGLGALGWGAAVVLLSLGSYGIAVGATMIADRAGADQVGRRLGSYRFVGDLGLIAGPAVSGVLYEQISARTAVLVVSALLGVVALLSGLFLDETRWVSHA